MGVGIAGGMVLKTGTREASSGTGSFIQP
jgi:hypothetical protein